MVFDIGDTLPNPIEKYSLLTKMYDKPKYMLNIKKSYGIIQFSKVIIRAAAAVWCWNTITANVGNSSKPKPTDTGKPATTARSVYPKFWVFSS